LLGRNALELWLFGSAAFTRRGAGLAHRACSGGAWQGLSCILTFFGNHSWARHFAVAAPLPQTWNQSGLNSSPFHENGSFSLCTALAQDRARVNYLSAREGDALGLGFFKMNQSY